MTLMTGFPLVSYLMEMRLGGRFRHLPPSVAAELEAFAAAEQQQAAAEPAPASAGDGNAPPPLRATPYLQLRQAC
jgi:hypothetical protein